MPKQSDKETGMSFFCRIGLHRWSFSTQLLDEPGHRTHTEIVRARCARDGCCRYATWSLVHRESSLPGSITSRDAPARLA